MGDRVFETLLVLVVLIFLGLAIVEYQAEMAEINQWNKFKQEHNCKVVGKKKGQTSTGVAPIVGGSNNGGVGIVVTSTPDQTGWLCDDGVTYWR